MHTQRKSHVRMQWEGGCLHAWKRALTRNWTDQHFYLGLFFFSFPSPNIMWPLTSLFWSPSFMLEAFLKFLLISGCLLIFKRGLKVKWSFLCGFVLGRGLVNKWNCCKLTLSLGYPGCHMIRSLLLSWSHSPEKCPLISCMGGISLDRERGQRVPVFGM